jgi:O-antigen/teichoic acid export membrane protein
VSNVRKALIYASGSQYLIKLLNFASVVILARILTPEELGIFAIATSVVMIVTEFRLLGTTNYLVREEFITKDLVRTGIGLTVLISWTLGILVFFLAPSIGRFYELDSLVHIFQILSISFFFAPFISVTSSILTRELKFDLLMYVNIAVQVIKIVASIVLIMMGFSYFGLAWGIVISTLLEVIIYRLIKPDIVSWKPLFKNFKPIVKFGVYSSLINIMSRFEAAASDIIIGKAGTPTQVAIFSRGTGFLNFISELVTSGVWQVALPHLSQVKRDGGDLATAYIKASLLLGAVVWPVLAVAGLASYPAIILIFGEQWVESVPIVSIMAGWAIFKAIHTLSSPLFFSSGKEKLLLKKQTLVFLGTILAMVCSVPYGLKAIAWSMVGLGLFDFLVSSWALKKVINLSIIQFLKKMAPNFILVASCYFFALTIDYIVDFQTFLPLYSFLILATVMPVVWLLTIWLIKHPILYELTPIFRYAQNKIKTRFKT